jgi:hypothetical protein
VHVRQPIDGVLLGSVSAFSWEEPLEIERPLIAGSDQRPFLTRAHLEMMRRDSNEDWVYVSHRPIAFGASWPQAVRTRLRRPGVGA